MPPREDTGTMVKVEPPRIVPLTLPADLIERLLGERPSVVGLDAPGMGGEAGRYQVRTFDRIGTTGVFATR
jgi:hypothetical protein